jgi:carotenoid 1,2-hydratase
LFNPDIPAGGYAWWYVDALSDDGQYALTIIAFIGSVFSPYYASRRRRKLAACPYDHCAFNIALYGPRRNRWAMTERRRLSLVQSARSLAIGRSSMSWDAGSLVITIDELTVPRFSRIRGTVRLHPVALAQCDVALDTAGRHRWRPIAPQARVEVSLDQPALRWRGSGYFDANQGAAPLESDFSSWTWLRSETETGAVALYDVERRRGGSLSVALRFDRSGQHASIALPPRAPLRRTGWLLDRTCRSEDGTAAIVRSLEDTPFYARSLISTTLLGKPRIAMHESLSLDRFRTGLVQAMLPFRMPRAFS